MMETAKSGSIGPVLVQFADQVTGEDAGDPTPGFEGSLDAARTSSERGVQRIEDIVASEVADLKQTKLITGIFDVAAGLAALGSVTGVLFGVGGVIAGILVAISTIMKALQTTDTFNTFGDVVRKHRVAVHGVRRGEVTLDAQ